MRRAVKISVLAASLAAAGCANAPSAVAPTLAAVEALGANCGDGQPDGVPSGLIEWTCLATGGGELDKQRIRVVLIDGNEHGVTGVVVAMDSDRMVAETGGVGGYTGPDRLRAALGLMVDRLPLLSVDPAVADALEDWAGEEMATNVGNARVQARCLEQGACNVEISPAGNPIGPLRLP